MRHYIARRPRKAATREPSSTLVNLRAAHIANLSANGLGVFGDVGYWVNRPDSCASNYDRDALMCAFLAAGSPINATMQGFYIASIDSQARSSRPDAGYGDLYYIEATRWAGPFTITPVPR